MWMQVSGAGYQQRKRGYEQLPVDYEDGVYKRRGSV